MNRNINLCDILKGLEGIKIYCLLTGEYVTYQGEKETDYKYIVVEDERKNKWLYTKKGSKYSDYPNGECLLVPSKEQWDWSKFEPPVKNVKEFNLEEAKNGAPVYTKDGRKAVLLKFDLKNSNFSILGYVINSDGSEDSLHWQNNGQLCNYCKSPFDLIMDN